jgi:hypothetical protein
MKLTITHSLKLNLEPAGRAVQHLLLTPSPTSQQKIERWSIDMVGITEASALKDGFGNQAHLVSQTKISGKLIVTASGVVETSDKSGVLGRSDTDPRASIFLRSLDARPSEELLEGLATETSRVALLHQLMDRVHSMGSAGQQQSQSQDEDGQIATPAQTSKAGVGSFVRALRWLDIPARYASGYLFDGDASRIHLWAEAWDNGLGWIGFDPALNVCPTESHVRLATGLEASDVQPIRCVPAPLDEVAHVVTITAEEDPQVPRT